MQKDLKSIFGNFHGLDEKSIDFLTKALTKNNLPGFDYLEFKQSLGAMAKMNIDEATAFKSAFATASTVGLTKDKLIKTAAHYKTVLSKEKEQFDVALQNQLHKRVKSKQEEVEKLKGQIGKWSAQIKKLEEQISKSQATIDNADAQIQGEMKKIETTKDNFEFTFQSILNQIQKDMENVNKHI